jgi:hypothetical protein
MIHVLGQAPEPPLTLSLVGRASVPAQIQSPFSSILVTSVPAVLSFFRFFYIVLS